MSQLLGKIILTEENIALYGKQNKLEKEEELSLR